MAATNGDRNALFAGALTDAEFERRIRSGFHWLRSGASLLRASRAVMRQDRVDLATMSVHEHRAAVAYQGALLAALATENGFKGVIVENLHPTGPSEECAFANDALATLAQSAGIAAHDADEADALAAGQHVVEWIGRYPIPRRARGMPEGWNFRIAPFCAAYERLFFRSVEQVARLQHRNRRELFGDVSADAHVADLVGKAREWTGGVESETFLAEV